MKELQSLVLSIELENDSAPEDRGLSTEDTLFADPAEISDPLALLEGALNMDGSDSDEEKVEQESAPENSESLEDDRPVPGGED